MKAIKFHKPKFSNDNIFGVTLAWYVIGSLSLLMLMYIFEWLIR